MRGYDITVPFTPGRADASQEETDVSMFRHLEPLADGFRNYTKPHHKTSAEEMLVDKAQLLTLTAPEMTVLVGGHARARRELRWLETRRFHRPTRNADQRLFRQPARSGNNLERRLRRQKTNSKAATAKPATRKWTGTRVDLIFGSNSELRALAEVYASDDAQEKFVHDFVAAWDKVMNLDRFDLKQ